jgi:hypothetical protein
MGVMLGGIFHDAATCQAGRLFLLHCHGPVHGYGLGGVKAHRNGQEILVWSNSRRCIHPLLLHALGLGILQTCQRHSSVCAQQQPPLLGEASSVVHIIVSVYSTERVLQSYYTLDCITLVLGVLINSLPL